MLDLLTRSQQTGLFSTIQRTFLNNPTPEAKHTLGELVGSLVQQGALPLSARDVWHGWAEKKCRREQS